MIISKMFKIFLILLFSIFLIINPLSANQDFNEWLRKFEKRAVKSGVSEKVVKDVMSDARFLPKVIEYDRYQPEFYEDTYTYIKKRSSNRKLKEGLKLYKKEK